MLWTSYRLSHNRLPSANTLDNTQVQKYPHELTSDDDLLFKGSQVIIQSTLTESFLHDLHEDCACISKWQLSDQSLTYWSSTDQDIWRLCQMVPYIYWMTAFTTIWTSYQPWRSTLPLATSWTGMVDISTFCWLFSEAHSPLQDVFNSHKMLPWPLNRLFSFKWLPQEICTDINQPFNFKEWYWIWDKYGFKHTTLSPHHPQSNGFIEWHFRTKKKTLSKTKPSRIPMNQALTKLQVMPISADLPSPMEILHKRPHTPSQHNHQLTCRESVMLSSADSSSRRRKPTTTEKSKSPFWPAHRLRYPHLEWWLPAKVIQIDPEPRCHTVNTPTGPTYQCNRRQLKAMDYTSIPNTTSTSAGKHVVLCSTIPIPCKATPNKRTWPYNKSMYDVSWIMINLLMKK